MSLRYLSVCSGVEAATVAWQHFGWTAAGFAEIESFPNAVLKHHYPDVPNFGDFTKIEASDIGTVDLLVGGTPCQDFSIAGLRAGLAGDRGRLTIEFCELAKRLRPRWLVWENVPGVLSADDGNAFGIFLGTLAELGYGSAYRVLDAQYFGVPQRRRRVFVVGYFGDWRRAAAVLFERESLSGHPAPRRETRERITGTLSSRSTAGGGLGTDFECDGGQTTIGADVSLGRGTPLVVHCNEVAPSVSASGPPFSRPGNEWCEADALIALTTQQEPASAVRRLTPRECERLQGFPDDYTLVPYRGKPAADGPRYKALGNSMAVPCMVWLGQRIQIVEDICGINANLAS